MKLFKATLMVCSAMVLGSNVNAMEHKSSSEDRPRKASASSSAENSFITDVDALTGEFLRVAINGSRGVGGRINPAENAYGREIQDIQDILQTRRGPEVILNKIKNMKDELKAFIRSQGAGWQKPAEIENIATALRYAKNQGLLNDVDTLKSLYMLLYTYVRIPGSFVATEISRNMTAASTISPRDMYAYDPSNEENYRMAAKANARDYYIREAGMRREQKVQAQELGTTLCPDKKVIGKLTKELFPFFSAAAFENGMVTDISTGDRKPLGTVQLKAGQWWKVYAMEVAKQSATTEYRYHNMYGWGRHRAEEFFTNAIRKIVSPYAQRFGKSANELITERDVNENRWDHEAARYVQVTQIESREAKLVKQSMTANGGGVFWKRDTSYDDGYSQSGMCTYVASTFESSGTTQVYYAAAMPQQVWEPNGDLINYTFVFEKTDAPAASDSFMQRVYADRRVYLTRVYAQTRDYYIRKAQAAAEQGNDYMRTLMLRQAEKIDSSIEQFGQSEAQFRAEKILKGAPAPESWGK
jgi:hypothetical protein